MTPRTNAQPTLASARRRLRELKNPDDATFLQGFFKTGPGQYGEGDKFLGIRAPVMHKLAKEFRGLKLEDTAKLLRDPWHEARLLALLLLVDGYERGATADREAIFQLYLQSTAYINNWDLVDASAANVVGVHLATRSRTRLDKLARSKSLWERRIAIVATHWFIRNKEFDDTLRIAAALLDDEHDLIHKAAGWMLREVGKRDVRPLDAFLEEHAHEMPRTMLRYAIEKMTPAKREHFMRRKELHS